MSVQKEIMDKLKEAMKSKDALALTALRALKSAFMLARTEANVIDELSEEEEIKIVQKQVKQRKDSAAIFLKQNREDLAAPELAEAKILEQFLPEALSEDEITNIINTVIKDLGAETMKDMGRVMGVVSNKIGGQADGKTISIIVKKQLA